MNNQDMLGHPDTTQLTYDETAEQAMKALKAGFYALEDK